MPDVLGVLCVKIEEKKVHLFTKYRTKMLKDIPTY